MVRLCSSLAPPPPLPPTQKKGKRTNDVSVGETNQTCLVDHMMNSCWSGTSKTSHPFISSVQLLSCVRLFSTPWTAACQASLSITNSRNLLKLMSIELVMPSAISSSVVPFSPYLQSFPASESFPMSQFFTSGGQSIGVSASASVLPMNIRDWFSLGLADLVSLQSRGLSRVFSNTTVQKHQFFDT